MFIIIYIFSVKTTTRNSLLVVRNMRRFISSEFQTDRGRPIYFNEQGVPYYAPLPNNYASAVEAGPILQELVVKSPKPVESIIPKESFTQDKPEKVYFDCDISVSVERNKKTKYRKKSKDNRKRNKHSKENFWNKVSFDTECEYERIDTPLYGVECDCYNCYYCDDYSCTCYCKYCEEYREYEDYWGDYYYDYYYDRRY